MASKENTHNEFDGTLDETPAPRAQSGGGDALFLLLAGLACTVSGLVVALGPKISWKLTQISEGLSYLGIHGGSLFTGGLILAGLGLVRRAQIQAQDNESSGEDTLLLEGVARDTLDIGNQLNSQSDSLSGLEQRMVEMQELLEQQLTNFGAQMEAAVAAAATQPVAVSEENNSKDAIFRLAATLDKVGARVEQRMESQNEKLEERLSRLEEELRSTCMELATALESAPQMAALERSAPKLQEPMGAAADRDDAGDNELEKPAAPLSLRDDEVPSELFETRLGVLDLIDDGPSVSETPQAELTQTGHLSEERLRAALDNLRNQDA